MHLSSHLHRKLRLLAIGTLVISALAASPALAARRVKVQRTGAEQCSVTPNSVSNDVPGWYSVSGSGFMPNQTLSLSVVSPSGGIGAIFATVLSDGTFNSASYYAPFLTEDGQWSVYVYPMGSMTVLASCSFTVT